MAKVSPGEFVRQVRLEAITRVHWPTRKETVSTAIMVLIMTTLLALFFFGVDAVFLHTHDLRWRIYVWYSHGRDGCGSGWADSP